MSGGVRLRRDGLWEGRVKVPGGKRISVYGKTQREAWTKLKAYQPQSTKRMVRIVEPARPEGPRYLKAPAQEDRANTRMVVVLPDQQAPHYDERLHELTCRWLDHNQPNVLVLSGDLIDLPTLSRYRRNPYLVGGDPADAFQRGLDSAYGLLRDYLEAAPGTSERYLLPGNHEQRLMNYLLDHAPSLYGVGRAGGGAPVMSLEYLLRLDELGIDFVVGETGEWPNAQVALTDKLAVRHGWLVRKNSGMTAYATLQHLGHSIVVGHTHRQATVFHTQTEIDGTRRVHVAVEAGTLALPDLGYAPAADWQQGFAVVRIHPDGTFHASLATHVNGELFFEGQRFSATARGIKIAA